MATDRAGGDGGVEMDVLLKTERTFPPPAEFAKQANANDPEIYDAGERRPREVVGVVGRRARLDRALRARCSTGPSPPFAKWFADGKLNASVNCLDRHVDAGQRRPGRLPLGGRGRRPPRRHLRRAARHDPALRQRAQGPRRRQGRRRRHLPADAARDARRDARLRPDRRDPQRRLRRLLGDLGQGADGVLATRRRWSRPTRRCAAASRPR